MKGVLRRQLKELRDPNHRRQRMDPMVDLEMMDEDCRAGERRERDAVCGCDSQFTMMDPIGTPKGQAGPDPIEDEFDLL